MMIPCLNLNLYLSLGCVPLKDVILHHPMWKLHIGNSTEFRLNADDFCRQESEKADMSIEVVPEMLSVDEIICNIVTFRQNVIWLDVSRCAKLVEE